MLVHNKCMLIGIKSWHDKRNISMCRTISISDVSDKQRKLMDNQARQYRPRIQKKIKEMPVGCPQENRTIPSEARETPRRGLEKKCQSGAKKNDATVGLENKCQSGVHKRIGRYHPRLERRHEEDLKINLNARGSPASP
jgi:hypothetical protein